MRKGGRVNHRRKVTSVSRGVGSSRESLSQCLGTDKDPIRAARDKKWRRQKNKCLGDEIPSEATVFQDCREKTHEDEESNDKETVFRSKSKYDQYVSRGKEVVPSTKDMAMQISASKVMPDGQGFLLNSDCDSDSKGHGSFKSFGSG